MPFLQAQPFVPLSNACESVVFFFFVVGWGGVKLLTITWFSTILSCSHLLPSFLLTKTPPSFRPSNLCSLWCLVFGFPQGSFFRHFVSPRTFSWVRLHPRLLRACHDSRAFYSSSFVVFCSILIILLRFP